MASSSSSLPLGLEDAHVFISGAAGGIGCELAGEFLALGCKVTCQWNRSKSSLAHLTSNPRVHLVQADLRVEEQVQLAFRDAVGRLGPVSILIVNHAIFVSDDQPLVEMTASQWRTTLEVNLTGSFLLIREYLRQLRTSGFPPDNENVGVVLIGSTAGLFGEAGHADYSASKAAMQGLMFTAKNEIVKIHPRGRVNIIAPGWVETPMAHDAVARGEHFRALQTTPLRKIAKVADVTRMIAVMSSGRISGHLSGALIPLHGGMEGRVLNTLESFRSSL